MHSVKNQISSPLISSALAEQLSRRTPSFWVLQCHLKVTRCVDHDIWDEPSTWRKQLSSHRSYSQWSEFTLAKLQTTHPAFFCVMINEGDDCQVSTSGLIQSQQKTTLGGEGGWVWGGGDTINLDYDIICCSIRMISWQYRNGVEGRDTTVKETVHVGLCIVNGQGFK